MTITLLAHPTSPESQICKMKMARPHQSEDVPWLKLLGHPEVTNTYRSDIGGTGEVVAGPVYLVNGR
ncbi:MAG: hypothetical protein ACI9E1_001473 [Cryomorphaceae bacterium]|jgi:hypothetical protein